MNLDPSDLPEHIRKLNPHLFVGGVEKPFTKPAVARALDGSISPCESGPKSVVISLVSYRSHELDDDNLTAGLKPLRDAVADTLGVNDRDKRLKWEYGQVITQGQQGTMVSIKTK